MKTKYQEPQMEVVACTLENIIVTSSTPIRPSEVGLQWSQDWSDALSGL